MNHECLVKVTQDVERLIADTKKLLSEASNASTQGVTDQKTEGIALLDKALERLNVNKNQLAQASDYALCKAKCGIHEHPMACLGMAALLGGVVGAIVSHRNS